MPNSTPSNVFSEPKDFFDLVPPEIVDEERAEWILEQIVARADQQIAEAAAPFRKQLLATLPEGCTTRIGREITFTDHGSGKDLISRKVHLSAYMPGEFESIAWGSGLTWAEAMAAAVKDYQKNIRKLERMRAGVVGPAANEPTPTVAQVA